MVMPSIFGENLFDDFMDEIVRPVSTSLRYSTSAATVMTTDIKEVDNGYELHIELPGYKKENISAELKDGYLTVSAKSVYEKEDAPEDKSFIHKERYTGSCSRSFFVGDDITIEDIKAKFVDGILNVFIPKKQPVKEEPKSSFVSIE